MNRLRLDDTIAAIATAPGEGAIGIVRLSGPESAAIAAHLFRRSAAAKESSAGASGWRSHRLYHGYVVDPATGTPVDEVLLAYMRAPRTYTRQDMVEISAHGGGAGLREILRLAVEAGARPAERGEMTLRAFLGGRLDLAQAEAVLDAVRARTPAALSQAVEQLAGGLSRQVAAVRRRILGVYAHLEATIDFAEDDVPAPTRDELLEPLRAAESELAALLATARAGRLLREGMRVAIVGRPNAGKSSLLNALVQAERAIVTPIPGTTRDVIEETIDLAGIPATLLDTAGIGETEDAVERIGVERSRAALAEADVALFVFDRSQQIQPDDEPILELARQSASDGRSAVAVLSKADLPAALDRSTLATYLGQTLMVTVSAHTGEGLGELRAAVRAAATGSGKAEHGGRQAVVTNARHRDALERAAAALGAAIRTVEAQMPADFVCIDLRACLEVLGEVTGESVTDDLLAQIFSQFCIGK